MPRKPPPLQAGAKAWTPAETKTLRESYARGGIHAALAAIPGRSRPSLYKKALQLGLSRRRRWTPRDDRRLTDLWGSVPLAQMATTLNRTITATYWRAQQIGLALGCPQGWEYLSAAAARTGYATTQLRRILAWADLSATRANARPGARRTKRPTHIVEPSTVDEVLERWHATETVTDAAHRRGMCDETLREWLAAAGVPRPKARKGRRPHWRVETAVIDRVIAERETLIGAATRIGVNAQTLAKWLAAAGCERRKAFVKRSDVDRVVAEKRATGCRAWRGDTYRRRAA